MYSQSQSLSQLRSGLDFAVAVAIAVAVAVAAVPMKQGLRDMEQLEVGAAALRMLRVDISDGERHLAGFSSVASITSGRVASADWHIGLTTAAIRGQRPALRRLRPGDVLAWCGLCRRGRGPALGAHRPGRKDGSRPGQGQGGFLGA